MKYQRKNFAIGFCIAAVVAAGIGAGAAAVTNARQADQAAAAQTITHVTIDTPAGPQQVTPATAIPAPVLDALADADRPAAHQIATELALVGQRVLIAERATTTDPDVEYRMLLDPTEAVDTMPMPPTLDLDAAVRAYEGAHSSDHPDERWTIIPIG